MIEGVEDGKRGKRKRRVMKGGEDMSEELKESRRG